MALLLAERVGKRSCKCLLFLLFLYNAHHGLFSTEQLKDPFQRLNQITSLLCSKSLPINPTQNEIQSPACSLMMRPHQILTLRFISSHSGWLSSWLFSSLSGPLHHSCPRARALFLPSTFSPLIRGIPEPFLKQPPSPPSPLTQLPSLALFPQHLSPLEDGLRNEILSHHLLFSTQCLNCGSVNLCGMNKKLTEQRENEKNCCFWGRCVHFL